MIREVSHLGLAIPRDEEHAVEPVSRPQMMDKGRALAPRLVPEAKRGGVPSVDQDDAFHSLSARRKMLHARALLGQRHLAARDPDVPVLDRPSQPLTGQLADLARFEQRDSGLLGGSHDGAGQRVLRIALEARDEVQDVLAGELRRHEDFGQDRAAVCQRAGLVEDRDPCGADPLQHRRILDDDPPPRGQGDGPDDRHGNRDQERAGRRDDQHGQEPHRIAARDPCDQRDADGHGRVDRTQLIGEAPQTRTALFRFPHDTHDLGVPGIDREPVGPDRQRLVAVDGPRQHLRSRSLGHEVGLARQVRLVHHAVSLENRPVDGTHLVREDDQRVFHLHQREGDVLELPVTLAMGYVGHPSRQRSERRRGAADCEGLDRFAAGQHEHDERPCQILVKQERGHDRYPGQRVGAELATEELPDKLQDQRNPAEGEDSEQRPFVNGPPPHL